MSLPRRPSSGPGSSGGPGTCCRNGSTSSTPARGVPRELRALVGNRIRHRLIAGELDGLPAKRSHHGRRRQGAQPAAAKVRLESAAARPRRCAAQSRPRWNAPCSSSSGCSSRRYTVGPAFGLNRASRHALKNALRIGRQGKSETGPAKASTAAWPDSISLAAIIVYWNTARLAHISPSGGLTSCLLANTAGRGAPNRVMASTWRLHRTSVVTWNAG